MRAHGGVRSARFPAPPGGGALHCGRADLVAGDLGVALGDTVEFRTWFDLETPPSAAAPFLMDFEGPVEACGFGSSPGVGLRLRRDGPLAIGGKFPNGFSDPGLPAPRRGSAPLPSTGGSR